MKLSYNEFHISKKVRDLCNFEKGLFASSGNVVFANMQNVRSFQILFNNVIETQTGNENQKVSAGQLNAMGLIDEIFHQVCMIYRRDIVPTFMKDLLSTLEEEFSVAEIETLLFDFINVFPPVEVYNEKCTPQEYLQKNALESSTNSTRSNKEQTLEELILLHIANENPAFKPFSLLFDDAELSQNKLYQSTWATIQKFAQTQPSFGPFNHDLINLLREPLLFAPESLKGQLEYIQKYWDTFMGEWLKKILSGMDVISEEEKAMWHGFGGGELPDMQAYSFENLMNEYERFSSDSEWMPNVILMAKTVLVWLDQLTKQYGYPITRLDQIPDAELDRLRDEGFTGLWLIGLWERSKSSKRIKQICGNPEAAASAYSLYDYNIAQNIGGWDALTTLRTRLWQRGIRLASDMVPNHTGMDGEWVINHPDRFIQRRDNPFPQYTYNGENLSQDGRVSLYLEDHYYSKDDCSVVFKRIDNQTGDTRYIYHGNDGTGLPWNDTAQIDFLNPEAREAVIQEILHVAQNFPIIRFDAAMVLAKKSIRRLWYPEPGHGGDIATRSETGLNTQQFNDAIPNEFWREVVDRVATECPDTLLLAEAFWMMEGYFVRTLGMHRVYNSAFMNMLKKEENQKYRDTIKNTINFDPQILKRYVNFMNNPDEETAIAQFGDGDKYFGCCTLMVTMPGLPMFGHGQIEGFTEKYGMEYTKAYKDEKPSQYLVDRHYHDIFPLMKKRYLFSGVENFLLYDLWQDGNVNENVFAYSNGCGNERTLVFYNNKYDSAYGWIKQSDPFAVKTGNADEIRLESRSISQGLNLTAEDDKYVIFQEHKSRLWYIRKSSDICEKGMFVMLNGFEYQVYINIQQVTDTADKRYKTLCEFLDGKGCEDIETAYQELVYKELYEAFKVYAEKSLLKILNSYNDVSLTKKTIPLAKILKECEKEALSFYKIAIQTEFKEDNKQSSKNKKKKQELTQVALEKLAKKSFALCKKRIKTVVQLLLSQKQTQNQKAKTTKSQKSQITSVDIQKLLEKYSTSQNFVKLMIQSNKDYEKLLLCWAICSDFADNNKAFEWNLGRKLNEYLQSDLRSHLQKIFLLSQYAILPKQSEKSTEIKKFSYKIVSLLTQSKYTPVLSGANTFDNIRWFNKELTQTSLNEIIMLMLLNSKEEKLPQVFKLYKSLNTAKTKSAYKCELFEKAFETVKQPTRQSTNQHSKQTSKQSTKKKSNP